jgi:hypothetical protein
MAPDDESTRAAEPGRPPQHRPLDPIGRATHLVLGSAAVVLGALGRGLLRLGTENDPPASPESAATAAASATPDPAPSGSAVTGRAAPKGAEGPAGDPSWPAMPDMPNTAELALAVVGLAAEVTRRVVGVAAAAAEAAEQGAAAVMQHQPVPEAVDRFRGEVTSLGSRGGRGLRAGGSAVMDFSLDVVAQLVPSVVTRLDLPAIVAQVDIPAILDRVDLDEIVDRIDAERIVRRLDLPGIAQGVLDQLDLTAISQRVLDQLDLTAVAMRVIDELELGELIRESSSTVTVEAVDALRVGGMNADRFVAQLMNRILLRRGGEAQLPEGPEPTDTPPRDPRP